ncbi:Glycosyl hydrolases family 16 [Gracilibacillus ureilyticus]|uniref:licheninase n=2 Tax=Gracilibacillus ureilyticus TaxID=531814 RepID=A0A1H9R7G8_9BACI|nr:Glycosyl hydrolases family 16 [Gracilibacillus ureilyticus]
MVKRMIIISMLVVFPILFIHIGKGETMPSFNVSELHNIPLEKNMDTDDFFNNLQIRNKYKEDGWTLLWNEEFDQPQSLKSNWNIENWAAEKNNELQFYTPDNVSVNNGNLHLISKKEEYHGRQYTSGAIHSKDKFYFQYGKVEIRAKLPTGQGMFPAFWMMPNIDNTWLPEIDILEMLGHEPDRIWMVQHYVDKNGKLTSNLDSFVGEDFSLDYHTYAIEWSKSEIIWLIDGIERFRSTVNIPSEEMYLYLNTAIGGNWPGSPDDTTIFPQTFKVDYVRVYQQTGVDS